MKATPVTIGKTFLLLLAAGLLGQAQADDVVVEERDVSGFDAVVFSGSGDLYINQSGEETLTIEAEPEVIAVITTEVRDGVLYIGRKRGSSIRTRRGIRFDLTVDTLESLSMSGSGDAVAGRLEADDFKVTISGSADVVVGEFDVDWLTVSVSGSGELLVKEINARKLSTSISGSGEVAASGVAENQVISITGSGDYIAPKLQSASVTANVIGSGSVDVWVTEELDAAVTGSGDVYYRGDPRVNSRVTGSGDVEQR
jgi:hypothetical protein